MKKTKPKEKPVSPKKPAKKSAKKPAPAPAKRPSQKRAPKARPVVKTPSRKAPKKAKPKTSLVVMQISAPSAQRVSVVGTFNDWGSDANLLAPKKSGEWSGKLTLAPGRYEYLFLVDGNWVLDSAARETVPNTFGGLNSILTVK